MRLSPLCLPVSQPSSPGCSALTTLRISFFPFLRLRPRPASVPISLPGCLRGFPASPLVFTLRPFIVHPAASIGLLKNEDLTVLLGTLRRLLTALRIPNVTRRDAAWRGVSGLCSLLSSLAPGLFSSLRFPGSFQPLNHHVHLTPPPHSVEASLPWGRPQRCLRRRSVFSVMASQSSQCSSFLACNTVSL